MGLFSRNTLTDEQIQQRQEEIFTHINNNNYSTALTLVKKLNKEASGEADGILAMMYFNGWGVEEDYATCVKYTRSYVGSHKNDKTVYYIGGVAAYLLGDQPTAIDWLNKAYHLGEKSALPVLGSSYYTYGNNLRDEIMRSLDAGKVTANNAMACKCWHNGIKAFAAAARECPEDMVIGYWRFMGWCAEMLYSLSCLGEMPSSIYDSLDQTVMSYGLNVVQSRFDYDSHMRWWAELVWAASVMDDHCPAMAELCRAHGSLLDAKLHKDSNAFYRARWHMKRAGELRNQLSSEDYENTVGFYDTVANLFKEMQRKYGSISDAAMRKGIAPNISVSYIEGKAPAVESCQSFMSMFQAASAPAPTPAAPAKKESSGGLLGKLFGRK